MAGGCLGFHHFGTFFLFCTLIFLIVACISAPVVTEISYLTVTLFNKTESGTNSSLVFGTFGWCLREAAGSTSSNSINFCSPVGVGYDIATAVSNATGSGYTSSTLHNLTDGLAVAPAAAGVVFVAFIIAGCSQVIGFLFASVVASLAWVLVLIALVIDVVLFGVMKRHVDNSEPTATASFSVAFWLIIASVVVLFFGAVASLFACITDRRSTRYY